LLKKFSTNYAIFLIFLDSALVMLSLKIAYLIRPFLTPLSQLIIDHPNPPPIQWHFYIIFAVIWLAILMMLAVYDPEKRLRFMDETSAVMMGSFIAIMINAGILYFTNRELSRVLFLSFGVIATFLLVLHRVIYRFSFRNKFRRKSESKRVLIVGAGIVGRQIGEEINHYSNLGFEVMGFVDDDENLVHNHPDILGTIDQTEKVLKKHNINNLIIALPRRAYDRINYLVSQVHDMPVRVWVIPDYFALALNQASIVDFAGFPLVDLRAPALNNFQRLTKRIFDLTLTIPFSILTLPLIGFIGLLIKLDSPGPIFYHSPRMKENGEIFKMIKFRTMTKGADKKLKDVMTYDEDGNPIHKHPNDPRVTKIGKFLRKTSLDELPQLINVIKGDMSLVGPRPEMPEMVERYQPWQRRRFAIPQGITGYWQVNGRSDKPMHLHTEEDIYYIQHYSIWFDIQILIKTIWVVIKGKGAY
jgi:exopolysaccharide biosynthesis polyprenyl glycosylphosphotransferase